MQVGKPGIVVTAIRGWPHGRVRVKYGPYNTICFPSDVFAVKQQIKLLPIICQTCGKRS